MKIPFKHLFALTCGVLLLSHTVNSAVVDLKTEYSTVMNYETSPAARITSASACFSYLKDQPGALLNLAKHLIGNLQSPHSITASELIPLQRFPKKFIWTLYPTAEDTVAVRNTVIFAQKLYGIKKDTKTIDLALNRIESRQEEIESFITNAITALISLKNLCLSYIALVEDQPHIQQTIKNLAFAIYTIQKGDDGVGTATTESISIAMINVDMDALPHANIAEGRLRSVRNILIDQDWQTSTNSAEDIPKEKCIFFTAISTALDLFITTYLVPCVRASLRAFETAAPSFEVPDNKRNVDRNDQNYTSFSLQKSLNGEQFVQFLTTGRTSAEQGVSAVISSITEIQLTKIDGVETGALRAQPASNTKIQAAFKAHTPITTESVLPQHFQIKQTDPDSIRQVEKDPFLVTFFPSS